jgi:hypothetical protein
MSQRVMDGESGAILYRTAKEAKKRTEENAKSKLRLTASLLPLIAGRGWSSTYQAWQQRGCPSSGEMPVVILMICKRAANCLPSFTVMCRPCWELDQQQPYNLLSSWNLA